MDPSLKSPRRFARFFDLSLDMMCIADFDSRFVELNPSWSQVLGYPIDELVGRSFYDFIHPDDLAATQAVAASLGQGSPTVGFENRYRHHDGSYRMLRWTATASAEDQLFYAVARDVTERKQLEADLERQRRRLETVLENAVDGILTLDCSGRIESANSAIEGMFGYPVGKLVGQSMADLIAPESAEHFQSLWQGIPAAGQPPVIGGGRPIEGLRADTTRFSMEVSVGQFEAVEGKRSVAVVRDVSERVRLQRLQRRLSAIIEGSPDMVGWAYPSGRVAYLNAAGRRLLGLDVEGPLPELRIEDVFPAWALESVLAAIPEARKTGMWEGRTAVRTRDGVEIPVTQSLLVHEAPGEERIEFISTIVRDLRERLHREAALEEARVAAEAASRAKSQFLAGMSHELRTPLNAIIGFSEILEAETFGALNPKQARYVGNIATSGRHLLQLINDILDLSKIEAGKLAMAVGPVSLEQAVRDAIAMLAPMAQSKQIRLEAPTVEIPRVLADSDRLRQILYNLLSNGIKFTPDGGQVEVSCERVGREVLVCVRDTGIGIAKGDLHRIFQEFEQVDSGYARQKQGTGLGLALTRRLVELLNGRLWVESVEGEGSCFSFTLPIEPDAQVLSQLPESGRPTVLVVEDEPQASEILCHYLGEAGYQVCQAFDGQEALRLARELRPQAITLDVMLPLMDGWTVLERLKADPLTQDIPVVMVSMIEDRRRGVSLGAVESLVKPVDRGRLVELLSRLEQSRSQRVLLIDDDPDHRVSLGASLRGAGFEVLDASGVEQGLEMVETQQPRAVLVNLLLSDSGAFRAVERLRQMARAPILVFTARELTPHDRELLNGHILTVSSASYVEDMLEQLQRILPTEEETR